MSNYTFETSIKYTTIDCIYCDFVFAVPKTADEKWQNNHTTFYCPKCRGNMHYSDKPETERLEKDLAYYKSKNASLRESNEFYQNSARAYKGHHTRVKNRVKNGVCPCCNRTFKDLQRHMKSKHPDFQKEEK